MLSRQLRGVRSEEGGRGRISMGDKTTVTISRKTRERLGKLATYEESMDSLMVRLCNCYEASH